MVKANQLQLIPQPRSTWRLSEQTKSVGRAGLAQARLALSQDNTVAHTSGNGLVKLPHNSPLAA